MSRVLICDDDPVAAKALAHLLRMKGHSASVACNAGEAMVMLESQETDLLVLDENIPYVSGLELLELVQFNPKLRRCPVVFWSAHDEPMRRQRALRAGAKDYLVKFKEGWPEIWGRLEPYLGEPLPIAQTVQLR
jgi:CheY-like chemotaxis protein